MSPSGSKIYQLKVTLRSIRPPIWRRIQVRGRTTLALLHDILQATIGWTNTHLHQFDVGGVCFGVPDPEWPSTIRNERGVRLHDIAEQGSRFRYDYDFGDGWEHDIIVEKILPPERDAAYPVCLKGKRSSPPEDCGGPWGYKELLRILGDPSHPEHEERLEWAGPYFHPEQFELDVVNELLDEFRPKRPRGRRKKPHLRLVKE